MLCFKVGYAFANRKVLLIIVFGCSKEISVHSKFRIVSNLKMIEVFHLSIVIILKELKEGSISFMVYAYPPRIFWDFYKTTG